MKTCLQRRKLEITFWNGLSSAPYILLGLQRHPSPTGKRQLKLGRKSEDENGIETRVWESENLVVGD